MANFNPQINAEIFKDRRVQIGLAVTGLLALAAVVIFFLQGGPTDEVATAPEMSGPTEMSPSAPGAPPAGFPGGSPGAPSMPGGAPGGPQPASPAQALPAGSVPTSFDGDGGPPVPVTAAPAPAIKGRKPTATRRDPFKSFYVAPKPPPKPPIPPFVYSVPVRVASPSDSVEYRDTDTGAKPQEVPLPYVPRRLSGVLHNGAVSAILETGIPPQADARVISPGARVPSGIPGVPDLIVESISSTQAVLRTQAPDTRSVVVRIGNLAPGAAAALRNPMGMGSDGSGGYPPGSPPPP